MGIDLSGKAAIVTGGARGIGKGMATALLEAGAAVTITDIRRETLEETSAQFAKLEGASQAGLIGNWGMVGYNTAKKANRALTRSGAREWAHYLTGETFNIDGGRCLRP